MIKLTLCILQVIIVVSRGEDLEKPQVLQDFFTVTGDGDRVMGLSCKANVVPGESLSWYQIKGPSSGRGVDIPHTSTSSTRHQMWIYLNLTLKREDSGTHMYCDKHSADGRNWTRSDIGIPLTFKVGSTPVDTPFVKVTPAASPLYFAVNETREFYCNGSKPIDGRKLTWLIQKPGSEPKYAEGQLWNNITFVSNLTLRLNESYNGTQIYCAQSYIEYSVQFDCTFLHKSFGENSIRSKVITLLQRTKENSRDPRGDGGRGTAEEIKKPEGNDESYVAGGSNTERENDMTAAGLEGPDGVSPLAYAVPIGVVVLLLASAAAAWACRRRRAPIKTEDNEGSIYAVPQVQYATLDLKSSTTEYASSLGENSPYAKIIGIYRPNLN